VCKLRPPKAAAISCRIAVGPRAEQKVLTLRGATPREIALRLRLCADIDGFSRLVAVRVKAHDCQAAEPIAPRHHPAGAVGRAGAAQRRRKRASQLKSPWRDGTTYLIITRWSSCSGRRHLVNQPRVQPPACASHLPISARRRLSWVEMVSPLARGPVVQSGAFRTTAIWNDAELTVDAAARTLCASLRQSLSNNADQIFIEHRPWPIFPT